MNELKIDKFTFSKDPWENSILMEWVELSNYCMFPDEHEDVNLSIEEIIKLIKFFRKNIKFTNEQYNEAFR